MQRGGSFLASGSYGCIYKPAIPCSDTDNETSDSVGKVFDSEKHWRIENKNSHFLQHMDKDHSLFVYPTKTCSFPSNTAHESESEINKCRFDLLKKPKIYQSIMPNAGVTITEFFRLNMPVGGWGLSTLINLMTPIFKGIDKLIGFGSVHQDVKFDNVVADIKGNARLIDFGLLIQSADFYDHNFLLHIYDEEQTPCLNPPEYRLFRGDSTVQYMTMLDLNKRSSPFSRSKSTFNSTTHVDSLNKLQNDRINYLGDEPSSFNKLITRSNAFRDLAHQRNWHKTSDIFSLGLLMKNVTRYLKPTDRRDPFLSALVDGMIMPHPDDRLTLPDIFELIVKLSHSRIQVL